MQLQPYSERAMQVAWESRVAVQIFLSDDNGDCELIRITPPPDGHISREDLERRNLRSVGVIGLSGMKTLCAFAEPLEPRVVQAIADGFLEYVRVLLGEPFAVEMAAAEVAELESLYRLMDPRPYPHA